MRILFVNDYYFSTTGSSIANRNLSRILTTKGIDVAVLTTSKPAIQITRERIHLLPHLFSCHPLYLGTPLIGRIEKIISKELPDIIHLQNLSLVSLVVLWLAQKKGITVIGGIHDLPKNISIYSPIAKNFVGTIAKKILVYWLSNVTAAVAPSEYAKSYYKNLGIQTDIRVISNGIDLCKFIPSIQYAKLFSEKYLSKIDSTKPRVLFVGRVAPDKDLEIMLTATRDMNLIPIIVGYAWPNYLPKLKSLASSKVIFTGHLTSPLLLGAYNTCHIFIQPSTTELQSLVVLEAMASGLPVIGVNYGPIPELIRNGFNGLLFEPYNPQDLKKKIELLLENNDLRKDMGSKSLMMVTKHSLENTANEYVDLYEEYS